MKRYVFIDTLRGLAACSVVLFHLKAADVFSPSVYQTVVEHSLLSVTAFLCDQRLRGPYEPDAVGQLCQLLRSPTISTCEEARTTLTVISNT
jgi:hypothetical protein